MHDHAYVFFALAILAIFGENSTTDDVTEYRDIPVLTVFVTVYYRSIFLDTAHLC